MGSDRLIVLAASMAAVAACSSGTPSCGSVTDPASQSLPCGTAVRFDGHVYLRHDLRAEPPHIEEVGDGVFPPCSGGCTSESTSQGGGFGTDLYRYRNADSSVAVVGLVEGTHRFTLYVRQGTRPSVLDHLVKEVAPSAS